MTNRSVVARNFAQATENRIHSDDVARRFGFTGGLVPGVAVFGHLAWPLTKRFGDRWLARSWVTTRFLKPAYDGETLSITDREIDAESVAGECRNAADVLLATVECKIESTQPPIDSHAHVPCSARPVNRVEIAWDTVHVDEPFAPYLWTPDDEHNREYAERVDDDASLFQQGVLHPHAILGLSSKTPKKCYDVWPGNSPHMT